MEGGWGRGWWWWRWRGQGWQSHPSQRPRDAPSDRVEGLDRVLHIVVQKCKGDGLTSKGVNAAIRNLKYTANSEKKCGEVVDLVFNRVIDGGLAEAVEEGAVRPWGG